MALRVLEEYLSSPKTIWQDALAFSSVAYENSSKIGAVSFLVNKVAEAFFLYYLTANCSGDKRYRNYSRGVVFGGLLLTSFAVDAVSSYIMLKKTSASLTISLLAQGILSAIGLLELCGWCGLKNKIASKSEKQKLD